MLILTTSAKILRKVLCRRSGAIFQDRHAMVLRNVAVVIRGWTTADYSGLQRVLVSMENTAVPYTDSCLQ